MVTDLLQKKLAEMEDIAPSPERTLSLYQRLKSWLRSMIPRDALTSAQNVDGKYNWNNFGTYDKEAAEIIKDVQNCLKYAGTAKQDTEEQVPCGIQFSLEDEVDSETKHYEHLSKIIDYYESRGWEVPEPVLELYEDSQRCVRKLNRRLNTKNRLKLKEDEFYETILAKGIGYPLLYACLCAQPGPGTYRASKTSSVSCRKPKNN